MNIEKHVAQAVETFIRHRLYGQRLKEAEVFIRECFTIAAQAYEAYENGVPMHEGPVWFGKEDWKTGHWEKHWRIRNAYREGQTARSEFKNREHNPYRSHSPPAPFEMLLLETAWDEGYDKE